MMQDSVQITLSVDDFPKYWYNVLADLPEGLPEPLNKDGRLERLGDIILQECIKQESSTERPIKIPEEGREA